MNNNLHSTLKTFALKTVSLWPLGHIIFCAFFSSNINALECSEPATQANQFLPVKLINHYPHQPSAFTQGLLYHEGFLYESTGLYGQSSLKKISLENGHTILEHKLKDQYFGEGIVVNEDTIFQLTWRSKTVFSYSLESFEAKNRFTIDGQGWGLTFNGENFIISDGSAELYWHDKDTFKRLSSKTVTYLGRPLKNLNELEWVNGCIVANIWQTPYIAIINPQTGLTSHIINIKRLVEREKNIAKANKRNIDVANGIAWHKKHNSLLLTGKLWSNLYEIQISQ